MSYPSRTPLPLSFRTLAMSAFLAVLLLVAIAPASHAAILRVKSDAGGAQNGSTWQAAFRTIQAALDAAQPNDEIWVAKGTYVESLRLRVPVRLYGGFAGHEAERVQRDWLSHATVIRVDDAIYFDTDHELDGLVEVVIDGFHSPIGSVSIGLDYPDPDGWSGYGTAHISNNAFYGLFIWGKARVTDNHIGASGIHIHASNSDYYEVLVRGNTVTGGSVSVLAVPGIVHIADNDVTGGGIDIVNDGPWDITGNKVTGGTGISALSGTLGWHTISSNIVQDSVDGTSPGIYIYGYESCDVFNNLVARNSGGGMVLETGGTVRVFNNTVVENSGGITVSDGTMGGHQPLAFLSNNIVAWNSEGLNLTSSLMPSVHHNLVFDNEAFDYHGLDPESISLNLDDDPDFVSRQTGDYRLKVTSPCRDAGDDSSIESEYLQVSKDLSGNARVYGSAVDIGAYEYNPSPNRLVFSAQPGNVVQNLPFDLHPIVQVVDEHGNLRTDFGGLVTLQIKGGTGADGAQLLGRASVPAVDGVATFTDLSVDRLGRGYVLQASGAGADPADSEAFNVGVPLHFTHPRKSGDTRWPESSYEWTAQADGVLEWMEWHDIPPLHLGTLAQDVLGFQQRWTGPDDYSAEAKIVWDENNLYFSVKVIDDVLSFPAIPSDDGLWARDGVEIFLGLASPHDPNRESYGPGDFQIIVSADDDAGGNLSARWYSPQAPLIRGNPNTVAFVRTDDGYIIEGAIPWDLLPGISPPVHGQTIGFNLMGKDRDTGTPGEDSAFSLSEGPFSSTIPKNWMAAGMLSRHPAVARIVLVSEPIKKCETINTPIVYEVQDSLGRIIRDFNEVVFVTAGYNYPDFVYPSGIGFYTQAYGGRISFSPFELYEQYIEADQIVAVLSGYLGNTMCEIHHDLDWRLMVEGRKMYPPIIIGPGDQFEVGLYNLERYRTFRARASIKAGTGTPGASLIGGTEVVSSDYHWRGGSLSSFSVRIGNYSAWQLGTLPL